MLGSEREASASPTNSTTAPRERLAFANPTEQLAELVLQ
jgi:hypothetical protein